MSVYLFFPAYNEEKGIEKALTDAHNTLKQANIDHTLVVVDDGSKDKTAEILNRLNLPLKIVTHHQNKGLGAALRTGIETIVPMTKPGDIIVTRESDTTQSAQVILQLINAVKEGADFSIASALHPEGFKNVPYHRQLLSHGGNLVYKVLFPIPNLNSYTNLSRAFKAELLQKALNTYQNDLITSDGFEGVAELVLKLRKFNPRAKEVPVVIDFSTLQRPSSMRVVKTILNSLKLCFSQLGR